MKKNPDEIFKSVTFQICYAHKQAKKMMDTFIEAKSKEDWKSKVIDPKIFFENLFNKLLEKDVCEERSKQLLCINNFKRHLKKKEGIQYIMMC